LKKNHLILGSLVLIALVALVIWGWNRIHFDFAVFRTQIALAGVVGASAEAATACAATLLLVTFLSIIPVGLIWARFEHVSLRKITAESEHASDDLAEDKPAGHGSA